MASSLPLKGIKVIEFAGLAPVPMCGMLLSDFGANVIRIDRNQADGVFASGMDRLARGKKSVVINLKNQDGIVIAKRLCSKADVLIEPFRAGVMEKLGLGPQILLADNPRLIYTRLTGYGQTGPLASKAGHDINYLAIAGVLSMIGREGENPLPPLNILGDFAGGSLMCAFGILMALFERNQSGKGQVIDANIVEGTAYLSSWLWRSRSLPMVWDNPRGKNVLDSGAFFYETYKTKDNKYMAVGAIEPQFYAKLMEGLKLDISQMGEEGAKTKLAEVFSQRTRAEWSDIFKDLDACVTPILTLDEAAEHPHNVSRGSFGKGSFGAEPKPAPVLSRTPGRAASSEAIVGKDTVDVLLAEGFTNEEVTKYIAKGVVGIKNGKSSL